MGAAGTCDRASAQQGSRLTRPALAPFLHLVSLDQSSIPNAAPSGPRAGPDLVIVGPSLACAETLPPNCESAGAAGPISAHRRRSTGLSVAAVEGCLMGKSHSRGLCHDRDWYADNDIRPAPRHAPPPRGRACRSTVGEEQVPYHPRHRLAAAASGEPTKSTRRSPTCRTIKGQRASAAP